MNPEQRQLQAAIMVRLQTVKAINIARALEDSAFQQKLAESLKPAACKELLDDLTQHDKLSHADYQRLAPQIHTDDYQQCVKQLVATCVTNGVSVDLVQAMTRVKCSNLTGIVVDIINDAEQLITPLLEIDALVSERIDATTVIFNKEMRKVTELLTKLYKSRLVNNEELRQWEKLPEDSAKCLKLHAKLKSLASTERKLAFIAVLADSNNKHVANAILRTEDRDVIEQKKQEAIDDLVRALRDEYKEIYKQLSPRPDDTLTRREFFIDFEQQENLMTLDFSSFVRISRERHRVTRQQRNMKSLDGLLTSVHENKCVLFQGDPGCGKTTLLSKWLYQWVYQTSQEPGDFERSKILLYIPMKEVRGQNLTEIVFEDLKFLKPRYKPVLDLIHREYVSRLVFFVDGLDENRDPKYDDIFKVLGHAGARHGQGHGKMTVYATCRMYASLVAHFRPYADIVITLKGVKEQDARRYIQMKLDMSDSDVDTFIADKKNTFGESILSIPIYLALICVIEKDTRATPAATIMSPETLFQSDARRRTVTQFGVFERFIATFKTRMRSRLQAELSSDDSIDKFIDNLFYKIGKMSFECLLLVETKNDFSEELFTSYDIELKYVHMLGLFTHGSAPNKYRFWHQTFEEYFAGAYYCTQIGFEQAMLAVLAKKGLLYESPNLYAHAVKQAIQTSTDGKDKERDVRRDDVDEISQQHLRHEISLDEREITVPVESECAFDDTTDTTTATGMPEAATQTTPEPEATAEEPEAVERTDETTAEQSACALNRQQSRTSESSDRSEHRKHRYEQFRAFSLDYEQSKARSLRETLRPMDGCFLFACGKEMQFAEHLFKFARHGCRLNSWEVDEPIDGIKRLYDTRFECSLFYEANTDKDVFIDAFVQFLTNVKPYNHWKHGQAIDVTKYNRTTATHVQDVIKGRKKRQLYKKLYELDCGLYNQDKHQSDLNMISSVPRSEEVMKDLLLCCYREDDIPAKLFIRGYQENLKVIAGALENKQDLEEMCISKMYKENTIEQFQRILHQLPFSKTLTSLSLINSELQCVHFEALSRVLLPLDRVPLITISGCNARNVPSSFFRTMIHKHAQSWCKMQCFRNQLTLQLRDKNDTNLFVLKDVFCNSLNNLVKAFTNTRHLLIQQSVLHEVSTHRHWKRFCEALCDCKLQSLTIIQCNMSEDYHLAEMSHFLRCKKTLLQKLCFHGRKIRTIEPQTLDDFLTSLRRCTNLRQFEFYAGGVDKWGLLKHIGDDLNELKFLQNVEIRGYCASQRLKDNYLVGKSETSINAKIVIPRCRFRIQPHEQESAPETDTTDESLNAELQALRITPPSEQPEVGQAAAAKRDPEVVVTQAEATEQKVSELAVGTRQVVSNLVASLAVDTCTLGTYEPTDETDQKQKTQLELQQEQINVSISENERGGSLLSPDVTRTHQRSGGGLALLRSPSSRSMLTDHERRQHYRVLSTASLELHSYQDETYCSAYDDQLSICIPADIDEDRKQLLKELLNTATEQVLCQSKSMFHQFISDSGYILTMLDLSAVDFSKFKEEKFNAIMDNMEAFVNLETLNLSHCGFSTSTRVLRLSQVLDSLRVQYLHFRQNSMQAVDDAAWTALTTAICRHGRLQVLEMQHCKLTANQLVALADQLKKCTNLRKLDLSDNNMDKLMSNDWKAFTNHLAYCKQLSYLGLMHTQIQHEHQLTTLMTCVAELKELKYLWIDFERFPSSFVLPCDVLRTMTGCKELRSLYLSDCGLRSDELANTLRNSITAHSQLVSIDLSANDFKGLSECGWKRLCLSIEYSGYLEEVNLSRCGLGSRTDLAALGKAFTDTNKLRMLDLSHNEFSEIDGQSWCNFCECLQQCTYLQELNLSDAKIEEPKMILDLAGAVAKLQQLTRFSLSHCPVSADKKKSKTRFDDEDEFWVPFFYSQKRERKTLSVKTAFNELFSSLQHCKMLRYLTLVDCNIQTAFASLAELVAGLQFLKLVEIGGNNLAAVAEVAWEHFFQNEAKCLKHISLAKCNLNPNHLSIIAASLKNCCNLETLDMSDSDFSEATAADQSTFCRELAKLNWMRALYLRNCKLKDRMLQDLLSATKEMQRLRILDISHNTVSNDCLQPLKQALSAKTHWQELLLSGCFSVKDAPRFVSCFTLALQSSANQIAVLELADNHLASCSNEQWKAFVHQLSCCFFLSKLNISGNELQNDKFQAFLDSRHEHGFLNLRVLQCYNNQFCDVNKHADYQRAQQALPALSMVNEQPIDRLQNEG